MLGTAKELNGKFGATTYINVIKGKKSKNISDAVKKLKLYNIDKSHDIDWWKHFVRVLISNNYLTEKHITGSFGSTVELTKQGIKWFNIIRTKYPAILDNKPLKINDADKLMLTMGGDSNVSTNNKKTSDKPGDKLSDKITSKTTDKTNANKRWDDKEEQTLLTEIKDKSIKEIATTHQRTEGGIRSRLQAIAVRLYNDGKSIDKIKQITKLTDNKINDLISKHNLKPIKLDDQDKKDDHEKIEAILEQYNHEVKLEKKHKTVTVKPKQKPTN